SGVQPPGVAWEERSLPDVAEAAEEHHHPLQPDAEPAVRRRAVPERVDVGGDAADVDPPLLRLSCQDLRDVHPLRSRDDLLTSDEHVEGVAVAWVVGAGHGVEWPHRRRVPAEHVEISVTWYEPARPASSQTLC
ncbi:Os02g0139650, partial [Oryza sativa Japonica Group]